MGIDLSMLLGVLGDASAGAAQGLGNYSSIQFAEQLRQAAEERALQDKRQLSEEAFSRSKLLEEIQQAAQTKRAEITQQGVAGRAERTRKTGLQKSVIAAGGNPAREDLMAELNRATKAGTAAETTRQQQESAQKAQDLTRKRASDAVDAALANNLTEQELLASPGGKDLIEEDLQFFRSATAGKARELSRKQTVAARNSAEQRLIDMRLDGEFITPDIARAVSPTGTVFTPQEIAAINSRQPMIGGFSDEDRRQAIKDSESAISGMAGYSFVSEPERERMQDEQKSLLVEARRRLRAKDPKKYAADTANGPIFPDPMGQEATRLLVLQIPSLQEAFAVSKDARTNPDKYLDIGINPEAIIAAAEARIGELLAMPEPVAEEPRKRNFEGAL